MKIKTLLFFLLFFVHFLANAVQTINLTDSTQEFWISREFVSFYIDTTNNLTLDNIISDHQDDFKSISKTIENEKVGYSYWINFNLYNSSKAKSFHLELYDFDINEIELYFPDEKNKYSVQKSGYSFPFDYRKIKHKNSGFEINLPQLKSANVYMRFVSSRSNNQFKPVIRSYEKAMNYGLQEYLLLGIFYGLLLLMIFYNGLYFIMLRKLHYLFYVIYAVSILVFIMNRNGTAFQYLWPNSPQLNPYTDITCLFIATISMLLFTIYFLELKNHFPSLKRALEIAIIIRIVIYVIELIIDPNFSLILIDALYTEFALITGIIVYRNKVKSSKWFIIAFCVFNIAFATTTLEILSLIPSGILTVYAINIGVILQFVFLSIGIAESVKETYSQKNEAQAKLISFQEEKNLELETKVKSRTQELEHQKELVEEKNNHILASVRYAKTIQTAILPNQQILDHINPNLFVLYMPRDIVSGDFYWAYTIDENNYLLAVADCTGHGVPGAFMSMIGVNLLNKIVSESTFEPNEILFKLHNNIQQVLNQHENNNSDGMDIAICLVNKKEKNIKYAGAKTPLVYIQNQDTHKIKATRHSIGGAEQLPNLTFELHTISYANSEISVYMFSDGYADQFGGDDNSKFNVKSLIHLLSSHSSKSPKEQELILKENILNWIGKQHAQIDDILVMGFEVN